MKTFIIQLLVVLTANHLVAKSPTLTDKELHAPLPKIIRTCCSFGTEVKVAAVPLKKVTNITSLEEIGKHHYLGDKAEGNGIIYTEKGGFIDLGHVRDCADWTAYLFNFIQHVQQDTMPINKNLGHEGGSKTLALQIPNELDKNQMVALAGRIAYDLSLWHEIATWFGSSYIPMIPEGYSSFSPEDLYSNLLGVTIGMEAIKSELPYEEAMTKIIAATLVDLNAVESQTATYEAMKSVEDLWWTRYKRLPSKKILLRRYLVNTDNFLLPWLIPTNDLASNDAIIPHQLQIPTPKSGLYQLNFRLNYKFPFKEIFPFREKRRITQLDFPALVTYIIQDVNLLDSKTTHKLQKIKSRKRFQPPPTPVKS